MATNRKSQKDRLLTVFNSGKRYSEKEIANRLNISNSRARFLITELRQDGYAIYRYQKNLNNGSKMAVYRLGTPSRKMVSLAYAYGGAKLFT